MNKRSLFARLGAIVLALVVPLSAEAQVGLGPSTGPSSIVPAASSPSTTSAANLPEAANSRDAALPSDQTVLIDGVVSDQAMLSSVEKIFQTMRNKPLVPLIQFGYNATQPDSSPSSSPMTVTQISNQANSAPNVGQLLSGQSGAGSPASLPGGGATGSPRQGTLTNSGMVAGNLVGTNVSPNYPLGPGDQLTLMLWGDPVDLGDLQPLLQLEVNRSGGIFFAPIGLLPAAGLPLADVERSIVAGLSKKYKRFDLRLSLGQLRQFPVTVAGFVNRPGQVSVTAAFGPFELLQAAGGVAKNGSLRALQIRSRDGKSRSIDMYQTLIGGLVPDLGLREGDVLTVPALGLTVAVAGSVNRPAIYEALPEETVSDLVRMGGGVLADAQSGGVRLLTVQEGRVVVAPGDLTDQTFGARRLTNGMLLEVLSGSLDVTNGIWIEGQVQNLGWFSVPPSGSLENLLLQVGLRADTDMTQAQLIRTNPSTMEQILIGFSPLELLSGKKSVLLFPGDRVRFFESQNKQRVSIAGEVEKPVVIPWKSDLTLEDVLAQVHLVRAPRMIVAQIRSGTAPTQQIYLRDLLTRKGGAAIVIPAGASIQFVSLPPGLNLDSATILGAVAAPGAYPIVDGMRLSELLFAAGGLTPKGALNGVTFWRKSILENQQSQVSNVTQNLESQISALQTQVAAATDPQTKAAAQAQLDAKVTALDIIKAGLLDTLGRISLTLPQDPGQLAKSDQNLQLEAGDRIYIPTQPEFISVLGAVYNQSTQAFVPGQTVGDAINHAGGVTDSGNLAGAFVIRSSGLVESSQSHRFLFLWDGFAGVSLRPGDAIVVPSRDPNSVDAWAVTKDALQLLASTVGVTANSLAILKTLGVLQ